MEKLTIRLLGIEDYEELRALWSENKGLGLRRLDDSREGIKKFLERNSETCFAAEISAAEKIPAGKALDGTGRAVEFAGAILGAQDGRRAYIYHAAVKEAYRGRGLGGKLAAAVEEAMKKKGLKKIALVAFKTNEAGNRFWEKMGYAARKDLVYRDKSLDPLND
ncbi:MAG: GNAT family N-acetyltransferase [Treponema sp.]|jgi:ribosomal protein S18 acetylase RimI-like enzyme|nr:GNAT family N-acetyltransferase [Treponema sp.]